MADTDLSPGMNAPNLWQPKEEEGEERAPPQINFAKEEEEEADSLSPTFCPRKKMGFGERKNGEGGHGGERRRRKRSQSPERLNGLLGHSLWVKGEKRREGVVWGDFFLSVCLAYMLYFCHAKVTPRKIMRGGNFEIEKRVSYDEGGVDLGKSQSAPAVCTILLSSMHYT